MAERNYKHAIKCKQCNTEFFTNHKRMYCTPQCREESKRRKKGVKPFKPTQEYQCACCGELFKTTSGTTSERQKNDLNVYCSTDCYMNSRYGDKQIREDIKKKKREEKDRVKLLRRMKVILTQHLISNKRDIRFKKMKAVKCKSCGNDVGYDFGRPKTYCSKECQKEAYKKTDVYKYHLKRSRQRTKSRIKDAFVEYVDPIRVIKQAGCKCALCNVSTPLKLRGTYKDNAPEIDHIKPLSKGGEHSYENVQCLCRRCNQVKKDHWEDEAA